MVFTRGHEKLGGRRKGTQNKTTLALKEALLESFAQLGGERWLLELARSEPKAYAQLLGRLLPRDVHLDGPPFSVADTLKAARERVLKAMEVTA